MTVNPHAIDKWAIMVCFDSKIDDWLYVTEDTGSCSFDLRPLLFDDYNQAIEHAEIWKQPGKEHYVQVVAYEE